MLESNMLLKPETFDVINAQTTPILPYIGIFIVICGIMSIMDRKEKVPEIFYCCRIWILPIIYALGVYGIVIGNPFANNNYREVVAEVNTNSPYYAAYFDNDQEPISLQNNKKSLHDYGKFFVENNKLFFSTRLSKKTLLSGNSYDKKLEKRINNRAELCLQKLYEKTGRDASKVVFQGSKKGARNA